MLNRYKIQQDKGKYCLKGCDDGDLVDYSAYAALEARCVAAEQAEANAFRNRDSAVAENEKFRAMLEKIEGSSQEGK